MRPSSPAGSPPTPDFIPSLEEILRYFIGVARMMWGKPDGLKRLDLSADGFWNSFGAIVVALPPTALGWIEYERVERTGAAPDVGPFALFAAHALADLAAWLFPILVIALAIRPLGFERKLVPLVVSLNWGSAFLAWALAPLWLLLLIAGTSDAGALLTLLAVLGTAALTARLVATALGSDILTGAGIVLLTIVCALMAYVAVTDVTGVALL